MFTEEMKLIHLITQCFTKLRGSTFFQNKPLPSSIRYSFLSCFKKIPIQRIWDSLKMAFELQQNKSFIHRKLSTGLKRIWSTQEVWRCPPPLPPVDLDAYFPPKTLSRLFSSTFIEKELCSNSRDGPSLIQAVDLSLIGIHSKVAKQVGDNGTLNEWITLLRIWLIWLAGGDATRLLPRCFVTLFQLRI